MRQFGPSFTFANAAAEKAPRFVITILFEEDSLYLTSHSGIPSVPDEKIENVLQRPSALSTRIVPDEGRSEIGAISFEAIDKDGVLTDEFRARLVSLEGLRGKVVELRIGYSTADFTEYQLFQTQKIQSVSFKNGRYSFKCSDITREQRKSIFDVKRTVLTASISATDTTIHVARHEDLHEVEHGSSYSDAPNSTVGYVRIEDEIIRYTNKTVDGGGPALIGCTRGVLNTRAVSHTVDVTQPQDQRTKVEEYVYLEMPAPKLALAILTGDLYGQAAVLPEHWHLGIDPLWIKEDDFTGIGNDLWNLSSDTISFNVRFGGLKKVDGKQFLEKEIYLLTGCYPTVYSDGRLGLKRMNLILGDAPAILEINETNAVSCSELDHDMDGISNVYQVQWNWTGEDKDQGFTRITHFFDAQSIEIHGRTEIKTLQFKGLYGSRHTTATVRARIDSLRDRYSHPPERMTVTVLPSLNGLEVGDIIRIKLPTVRDYVGAGDFIDRSFEIQRTSTNHATGEVTLELFGSTGRGSVIPTTVDPDTGETQPGGEGPDGENSLPDAWYTSEGTDLSTVVDITVVGDVGVIDAGTWNLTGHADLNNAAAIYYYNGDLQLPNGVTLQINDNVQLRVKGFFEVNGQVDGVGRGLAGQSDTTDYGTTAEGLAGFGHSRGMDGLYYELGGGLFIILSSKVWTLSVPTTRGTFDTVPLYDLRVVDDVLEGLPSDLRGTSGGPGGKISDFGDDAVRGQGGAGADGGAGLCIVSRGLSFGASALIDLSGADSAATTAVEFDPFDDPVLLPGAGGAGAPGALLIALDGNLLDYPDIGGKFVAATGHVGAPLTNTLKNPSGGALIELISNGIGEGYLSPSMISDFDMSNQAYRIQYITGAQTPAEDAPTGVPAPTNLTAEAISGLGILLTATLPPFDQFDAVEYWGSDTNDRDDATLLAVVKSSNHIEYLGVGVTRYYWCRCVRGALYSDWFPASSTAGIEETST